MAKIRCRTCETVAESKHRHDFQTCECGNVSIDGGTDYTRIGYPGGKMEDHVEILEDENGKGKAADHG